MRASSTEPFAQVYGRMTRTQQDAVDSVGRAQDKLLLSETIAAGHRAMLYRKVYEALRSGVPARILGERLDISVSRVYQIRDEVAEWESTLV